MSPELENNLTLKCCCTEIFQHNTYIRVIGKIPIQHFNALFYSNPGDKALILVESRGQIFPIVFNLFWILGPGLENNAIKCWSCIFSTMLENCSNNISIYGCSKPGDNILFQLKFYEVRISEWNIRITYAKIYQR